MPDVYGCSFRECFIPTLKAIKMNAQRDVANDTVSPGFSLRVHAPPKEGQNYLRGRIMGRRVLMMHGRHLLLKRSSE